MAVPRRPSSAGTALRAAPAPRSRQAGEFRPGPDPLGTGTLRIHRLVDAMEPSKIIDLPVPFELFHPRRRVRRAEVGRWRRFTARNVTETLEVRNRGMGAVRFNTQAAKNRRASPDLIDESDDVRVWILWITAEGLPVWVRERGIVGSRSSGHRRLGVQPGHVELTYARREDENRTQQQDEGRGPDVDEPGPVGEDTPGSVERVSGMPREHLSFLGQPFHQWVPPVRAAPEHRAGHRELAAARCRTGLV
jgi:hypothetical protein